MYQRNWTVGRSENEARIVPCHHLQDIAYRVCHLQ